MILPSTQRGGVEEYTLKITGAAVKEGFDVHVAFPQTEGTRSLIPNFTAKGVDYHCLQIAETARNRLERVRKYFTRFARTVVLLLKIKPDLVQLVLPGPDQCFGTILACALLQVPTVVRFGLLSDPYPFSSLRRKIYAWARARKQQWIAVSENNRKLICESFEIPDNEVLRIYNGVKQIPDSSTDNERKTQSTLRHQVRRELGLPETSRLALTVGRLDPQKGYSDLIPVIPYIVREFPDVRFVWVGDGEQRDYLVSKVREYNVEDKVFFLGYRSDVPRFLKAADLFVFPTHYEGHSNALNEAMAQSLPIIASDASSVPEFISDKVHGRLFHTGDSHELLETLRWALRHPDEMQEMGRKARLRIQEFPEQRMFQETMKVWGELCSGS
jgi:glycosyltransferase involved in cell wall biosynthesis